MNVRSLRDRVRYDTPTQGTASPYGDSAQVWLRVANLQANVDFLKGEKLERAHEVHAEATVSITIRYRRSVTAVGRFVFEGQNFYIAAVIPDSRKTEMMCVCYVRPQENVT